MDTELAALVARMADGDDFALATLYDVTSPTVHGLVLRIVRDTGAAEEVTIDAYTQAFRQAAHYDSHRGSPWAWLLTIARSRAIDRVRAERRRTQAQQPLETLAGLAGDDPDPEASSSLTERARLVRAALARLSPDQRQAIEIAYFSGLSQSEIAERLGHPIGTVKTRIRTGLMRLREALTPLLVEDRP
jgi:RNA polymerase sigma-70 factor (ECF subfamily)